MRQSYIGGIAFGLTSGVITTLGLIIGLKEATGSVLAVVSGILVIAISDALSDALGMHLTQESDPSKSQTMVWEATFSTFMAKFLVAMSFALIFLVFAMENATIISVVWGLVLISALSRYIAKVQNENAYYVIAEHLLIAGFVILVAHFMGIFAKSMLLFN
jgi:VIT1/CCC1 family predicted Fe2+/Mn2+ transporter